MGRQIKIAKVPLLEVSRLQRLCSQPDSALAPNSLVYNVEVLFDDGRLGCVQVTASNDPATTPCISCAAIFEDVEGAGLLELACTRPGNALLGEYSVNCGGAQYVIDVIKDRNDELE